MEIENTTADVETTNLDNGTGDAFLEAMGFGNAADSTNATDYTEGEADQQTTEEQTEATAEAESKQDDNGRDYTIRYRGKEEILHLTDEQLIKELQKARDYDSVRAERDELKGNTHGQAAMSVVEYFAAQNGMSTEDYIAYCNEQMGEGAEMEKLTQEFGELPEAAAKELLAARREAAAKKAAEADEAKIKADLDALKAEYPDADISNLPSDVQADIENGLKPVEAMRLHELRELRKAKAELNKQIESLKKEKDNRSKAPGRLKDTAGDNGLDAFMKGFMKGG